MNAARRRLLGELVCRRHRRRRPGRPLLDRPRAPVSRRYGTLVLGDCWAAVPAALAAADVPAFGLSFAVLVAIHRALTHQRVAWLLREGGGD